MAEIQDPITAVIIVDHGSRRQASNDTLETATKTFANQTHFTIVEPAHMELAQPDIAAAFRRCVERGAERIVVFPYFLSPGRHWSEDIPALVEAAAVPFPAVEWLVTAPFGLHSGMCEVINDRIRHCMDVAASGKGDCDACSTRHPCQLRVSGE